MPEVIEGQLTAPVVSGNSKVIRITDPQAQTLIEKVVDHKGLSTLDGGEILKEHFGRAGYRTLQEAATTAIFPALLRDGLKAIMFNSYNMATTTYQQLVFNEPSNKPAEDWLELNTLGTLPAVGEGTPYPEVDGAVDRAVRIVNVKRGMRFSITEEMIKFDRVGMIKQYPTDLGRAAKMTIEQSVYTVLATSGNYVRNSTTADNDIGANTASTTFSAEGLNLAYATLRTMRDRKSQQPLGIMPDTIIVAPQLEMAAKQLLLSPLLWGAAAVSATAAYGTGTTNPFRGLITNIIVSPFLSSSYGWALGQAGKGLVYQEVDPLQLLTQGNPGENLTPDYFVYDKIGYRVRVWFGTGFTNDRFWFLSTSTTKPVVL